MDMMLDTTVNSTPEYKHLVREMTIDMLEHQAGKRSDYYIDALRKIKPFQNDLDKLLRFNGLIHQAIGYIQGSNDAINKFWEEFGEELKQETK